MTAEPYAHPRTISPAGMAFVLLLHGLAFWLLLQLKAIGLPAPLAVLSVSLIEPAARLEPAVTPPRPRPVEKRPMPQPVPLVLPTAIPTPVALTQAPPAAAPVATTAAPAPVPAAPTAPRFDADYLDNPKPIYPSLSRRLGEEGRVTLRVHVLSDGRADDVRLHIGSGSPRLDQSALDTVRRWRFAPARFGTEVVAAWVLIPIVFSLKE